MKTLLTIGLLLWSVVVHATTIPQGYLVNRGTTVWNASGSSATQGLGSVSVSVFTTATCQALEQVTEAQVPNRTSFPHVGRVAMPNSGSYIKATCSGGISGGIARFTIDIPDQVLGYGLVGQFWWFSPTINNATNTTKTQFCTEIACTNRMRFSHFATTIYTRRKVGWNFPQVYCRSTLTFPDMDIETGAPTCLSTVTTVRLEMNVSANVTETFYFGDIVKQFYAKPQITVWSADGDNTAYTVMLPYMQARNIKGSYTPTIGEINQGANPMPLANLLALANAGWSIHAHQSTSVIGAYTSLSATALASELRLVKSLFTSQRIPMSLHYCTPGGNINNAVSTAIKNAGFSGFGCGGNVSADANGRMLFGGIFNELQVWTYGGEAQTFAVNKAAIEHAIAYGETLSLLWHKVDGSVTCGVSCFQQVIDLLYTLRENNLIDLVTWDELYLRSLDPRY